MYCETTVENCRAAELSRTDLRSEHCLSTREQRYNDCLRDPNAGYYDCKQENCRYLPNYSSCDKQYRDCYRRCGGIVDSKNIFFWQHGQSDAENDAKKVIEKKLEDENKKEALCV